MIIESDKIEKKFPSESIYALADKGQLQQVIFNLLKNASHVIDKEKGIITVGVDKNSDDKVAIKITDNGPGIPQKVLNKLFTPFFTTKEPGKGTGLGLALVKIMTERNNGIIKVESEEGKGTTFTLVFKGER
jgi:signal transduction histidine kinase